MNCFIHHDKVAVATCKRCGKAMCENCSAYSGHSGVCPECRLDNYRVERTQLDNSLRHIMNMTILWTVLSVLDIIISVVISIQEKSADMLILLFPLIIFVPLIIHYVRKRRPLKQRLTYVEGEITKLEAALRIGVAEI